MFGCCATMARHRWRLQRLDDQRRFATTRRPSVGSRCRPLGVKTTCGTSPLVMRVSGTASSWLPPPPTRRPRTRTSPSMTSTPRPNRLRLRSGKRMSTTSRLASTSSTFRPASLVMPPTGRNNDSVFQMLCHYRSVHLVHAQFVVRTSRRWYFKAGLRERWTPLGHTVLYGEYAGPMMPTRLYRQTARHGAGDGDSDDTLGLGCGAGDRCSRHVDLALLPRHEGDGHVRRCRNGRRFGSGRTSSTSRLVRSSTSKRLT